MKLEFWTNLGWISSLIYYFRQKPCKVWQCEMSFEFKFSGSFKPGSQRNPQGIRTHRNWSHIHYKYFQDKNIFWPLTQILFFFNSFLYINTYNVTVQSSHLFTGCGDKLLLEDHKLTVALLRMIWLKCKISESFSVINPIFQQY